jgi:hypothetical protein
MKKKLIAIVLICTTLFCLAATPIFAASDDICAKIDFVNGYLKDKYKIENMTNTRVSGVADIVKYNYSGTVLMTSEYNVGNDEWITVAHNDYGFPFIAAYGSYSDEEYSKVRSRLNSAFNEIFDGTYDFSKNEANIAWIYLDGTDCEKLDSDKLETICANSMVTDEFLKAASEVSYSAMKIVPYIIVGYEKTPDKNDGNKVYASAAETFRYGMYYATSNTDNFGSFTFEPATNSGGGSDNKNADPTLPGSKPKQPAPETKPICVTIDGKAVSFDVQPVMVNSRVMVPFRKIFEALGAQVSWDASTRTATGTKGGTVVTLVIDSTQASVNGETKILDSPAIIMDGRTLVPARFISESLGYNVQWDNSSRTVVITSGN